LIKTILKLVVVVIILNGLFRTAMVAWDYFQLKDEAQQLALFAGRQSTDELHDRIMAKAQELAVPLQPENLYVTREGGRTVVIANYQQPLEYFPSFVYPMDLSFNVEAFEVQSVGK
jgi:hypothetical protein